MVRITTKINEDYMKILKPLLLSAILGASMGVFSTASVAGECAEDKGRTCYEPLEAISLTVELISEARHAIDNGGDKVGILNIIKSAVSMNKNINANDTIDVRRSRASSYLKKAKSQIKKGNYQNAHSLLLEGENKYKELPKYM